MFSPTLKLGELSHWFSRWLEEDDLILNIDECIEVRQESYFVALYDIIHRFNKDDDDLKLMKKFEIPYSRFIDFLTAWDEIQINKPDTFLVIIDRAGEVRLESDPVKIKRYQDLGDDFGTNKVV